MQRNQNCFAHITMFEPQWWRTFATVRAHMYHLDIPGSHASTQRARVPPLAEVLHFSTLNTCSSAIKICKEIMFDFYTGLPRIQATLNLCWHASSSKKQSPKICARRISLVVAENTPDLAVSVNIWVLCSYVWWVCSDHENYMVFADRIMLTIKWNEQVIPLTCH